MLPFAYWVDPGTHFELELLEFEWSLIEILGDRAWPRDHLEYFPMQGVEGFIASFLNPLDQQGNPIEQEQDKGDGGAILESIARQSLSGGANQRKKWNKFLKTTKDTLNHPDHGRRKSGFPLFITKFYSFSCFRYLPGSRKVEVEFSIFYNQVLVLYVLPLPTFVGWK